ncbi:MAG: CDP-alcohol phosphatidyltransferase family protein [Chloroflexi bacterium]|nr:CDP-alcohol phosphatidyltransferase family protein [Chloroflexota bacterium]MYC56789.1 CDP-alcohol phosphatidyltransferase family protein [Chloroflexota bacterium]
MAGSLADAARSDKVQIMPETQAPTLTDRLRAHTQAPLDRLGAGLARLGLQADQVTIFGLLLVGLAALLLAQGAFLAGALLMLCSLPLDALDGAVARAAGRESRFGMVLDSTLDRYADGFIFAAFGYYFAEAGRMDMLAVALVALLGSFMVSYIRARADDAKVAVKTTVGLFTRLERVLVLLVMTFAAGISQSPAPVEVGLLLLAAGTNLTALQRLRFVHRTLKGRGE